MGTVVGAGVGYAKSDRSSTQQFNSALKGAVIGGLGVGLGRAVWANTSIWGTAKFGLRAGYDASKLAYPAARGVANTALWAAKNPGKIAAVGVGIAGIGLATRNESPTEEGARVQANYDQQAIMAENMQSSTLAPMGQLGSAPQMLGERQRRLMKSTNGLVNGLHMGRHG
jgi:hypothetical protein